jgi:Flp pilus assembly protein TadD
LYEYGRSLAKQPTASAWLAIGRLASRSGDQDQAVAAYQEALALNPNDPQALYDLGVSWLRAGDPAGAVAPLEHAVRLLPEDELLRTTLERARRRSAETPPDSAR